MRNVCVVIGSRQNWGRLKSVVNAVAAHPNLQLQMVLAASAIGRAVDVAPYHADARIQCLIDGDNHQAMALTTGLLLTQSVQALEQLRPDVVLVHGDRYELLAVAMAAAYMNIPLAHTEGGEITGCIDDKVRDAITSLADIHFPVTQLAAKKIISMGALDGSVHMVGSTALDGLAELDLYAPEQTPYVVILHHPNTTQEENIDGLFEALRYINLRKLWVNPNVDAGSKAMLKRIHNEQGIDFVKDLAPEKYAKLIYNCKCLIGNTSSGIKEGAFLGVPYVCIGDRQAGREHGDNVVFSTYDKFEICERIAFQINHGRYVPDYRFGDGTAGRKVAEILARR